MRIDKEKNYGSLILINILPLISVLSIVLTGILKDIDTIDLMKISLMNFIFTTVLVFYIRTQENLLNTKYAKSIIFSSYFISLLLLMLVSNPQVYSFWIIGSLLTAMLLDKKLGLLVYFNMTFVLSITYSIEVESMVHFLIMGILFILLSDALNKKATVIYASIILLSINITLAFIMNNFIYDSNRNVNYLASFFSIFAVLVTAFLLSVLYNRLTGSNLKVADEIIEDEIIDDTIIEENINDNTISEEEHIAVSEQSSRTNIDVLLSEDNELLLRLKEHSESLYNHCRLIGDLSAKAASLIGADVNLARAGGYYHEVGKIIGKNYIEEGLKLAEEYAFPDKLKEILKEHNIKYDKPTSVESAIVMISDNVATTIEYIDKTGDQKFTSENIIDNIFRLRLDKGTFDDSGLSVRDYRLLKEFYQKEFKSNDRED